MPEVPALPRWLSLLGILPQAVTALAMVFGAPEWRAPLQQAALIYGAVGLTFLAGMWWGIAAMAPAAERRRSLGLLWSAAVIGIVIALACLLPPLAFGQSIEPSLVMLGAAIIMTPAVDTKLGPLAPRWWMGLRVPLAVGLGAATFGTALA